MPTYEATDPNTGKTIQATGDTPPTDAEWDELFASVEQPQTTINNDNQPQIQTRHSEQEAAALGFGNPAQQAEMTTQGINAFKPINIARWNDKAGILESAMAMGSSMAAEPIAGIAGLVTSLNPFTDTKGADVVQDTRDSLTYQPRTDRAKEMLGSVGETFAPIGEIAEGVSNFTGDVGFAISGATGGAIGKALPTAILELVGIKGISKIRGTKRIDGISDTMANTLRQKGLDVDALTPEQLKWVKGESQKLTKEQSRRLALFEEEGIQATKGDITQEFEQIKGERILNVAADEAGDHYRQIRLQQSRDINSNIGKIDVGDADSAGGSIKGALNTRKAKLRADKNNAYKRLNEMSEGLDVNLDVNAINGSLPDARTMKRIDTLMPSQSKAVDELMKDYGLKQVDVDDMREITPLTLENFEDFRVGLNSINKSDQTGTISNIINPLKRSLDDQVDITMQSLVGSDIPDVAQAAKNARASNIKYKTEFDDKALTSQLIDKKRRSVEHKTEDSQVYAALTRKSTSIEGYNKVINSLKRSKLPGRKALSNLRSHMVLEIVENSFSSGSMKIKGERVVNANNYQKTLAKLRPKMEKIFSKAEMRRFDNLSEIAEQTRAPSGAIPVGSAPYLVDVFNKLGINAVLSKFPGGNLMADKIQDLAKAAKNKKTLKKALERPEIKETYRLIEQSYPALFATLGIAQLLEEDE